MGWLSRLRRRDAATVVEVVVLTRAGCHLCEEMEAVVAEVVEGRPSGSVRLDVVDLDEAAAQDPGLLATWTTAVPVLLVDGVEVARWRVDPATVRSALGR